MNLKDKRRDMELRLLDKFPQYGDIIYSIIEELEEQDKQAIKDLKDKLFIKTKKGRIVIPACKIIPTIDKIMGVWEE